MRLFRSLCLRSLLLLCALSVGAVASAQTLTGDHVSTNEGGDLVIHPINHATFAMAWNGTTIYVDPVGGAQAFAGMPGANLVLITDIHGDHLNADTLTAVVGADTTIVAPQAVAMQLPAALKSKTTILANGETKTVKGISIEAIPMYNTTKDRLQYHTKGRGNGYVVTLGGKRVYLSGDTEDIPEMRALKNIDVAFVCFNLPYTMTEEQAASAVRAFAPKIVYPYHYRGSDLDKFKRLVGTDKNIEVRFGKWY